MTLFSSRLKGVEEVFALWDFFILEDDPFIIYFIGLAFITHDQTKIRNADVSELPEIMTKQVTDVKAEEIREICRRVALQCY